MIVFIDLGEQIQSEIPQFAFFNTLRIASCVFHGHKYFLLKKNLLVT